ncbi:MAG: CDP-alcohol phosphatidyltransferase family protein [Candidatus Caenarcaniphilales bacterium]|nr:CDP-alcohol phosphatidyltransferase family protein [Candidatus Caenarcaniphilales bacterium]
MLDDKFRPLLPKFTGPLIKLLIKLKVTPNQVTVLGFLLACIASFLIGKDLMLFGLIVWWISRLADGLDGMLARETNQKSFFGGYLDILLDMASYSIMIIGFASHYKDIAYVWNWILLGYVLCITSVLALSSIIEGFKNSTQNNELQKIMLSNNRTIQFTVGLAEATETNIMYTCFTLFPSYVLPLVYVWLFMLIFTVLQRTFLAWKLLRIQT